MQKTILPLLALILIQVLSSCTTGAVPASSPTAVPPTTADITGKWESEHGFFIIFDDQNGSFSGSNVEEAADAELGILGTFSLTDNRLSLVENDDSESCPSVEGLFEAAIEGPQTSATRGDKLHLTIIEDDCIYRVEGLFQIGQGGNPSLKFQRVKE